MSVPTVGTFQGKTFSSSSSVSPFPLFPETHVVVVVDDVDTDVPFKLVAAFLGSC